MGISANPRCLAAGAQAQQAAVSRCLQRHLGSAGTSTAAQVSTVLPGQQRGACRFPKGESLGVWMSMAGLDAAGCQRTICESWLFPFSVLCAYYCC